MKSKLFIASIPRVFKALLLLCVLILVWLSVSAQTDSTSKSGDERTKTIIDFKDPPNIKTLYKYDANTGNYLEILTVGGKQVGSPKVLTLGQYLRAKEKQDREAYYRKKSNADKYVKGGGIIPKIAVTPEIFDKVFGGGIIDIKPTGSAEVTFGGRFNKVENPTYAIRQQLNGQFDFWMKMQLNVTGQIGDLLKLNWNYDTEATFEF